MAGVTDNGLEIETTAEAEARIKQTLWDRVDSRLRFGAKTWLGQIVSILSEDISLLWEAAQIAYNAFDPDRATEDRLVALAKITGTVRRQPQRGTVTATCNLSAGKTFAVGDLVAYVTGNPANRWSNSISVTTTTTGSYSVPFQSEIAGASAIALAGTLTKIAEPTNGFNSITNAADAVPGLDLETIEELRSRRELELQLSGGSNLSDIVASVSKITSVAGVAGFENYTESASAGLPPKTFEIVVWGGSPNDIAQAIFNSKPAGIKAFGLNSGVATEPTTQQQFTVSYTAAAARAIEVTCTIEATTPVTIASIRSAILAAFDAHNGIGKPVRYGVLFASALTDGVDDVTGFGIRFDGVGSYDTDNLILGEKEIATLASTDITVTGDVV